MPKFVLTYRDYIGSCEPRFPYLMGLVDGMEDMRYKSCKSSGIDFSSYSYHVGHATGFNSNRVSFFRFHPILAKSQNYLIEWFYYFFTDNETNYNKYDVKELIFQSSPTSGLYCTDSLLGLGTPKCPEEFYNISNKSWELIGKILEKNTSIENIRFCELSSRQLVRARSVRDFSFDELTIRSMIEPPKVGFDLARSKVYSCLLRNMLRKRPDIAKQIISLEIVPHLGYTVTSEHKADFFSFLSMLPNTVGTLCLRNFDLNDNDIYTLMDILVANDSNIQALDLSNNRITYTGARYISGNIRRLSRLKVLNLGNNRIACLESLFQQLSREFFSSPTLELITIEHNFIDRRCKALFQKPSVGLYRYNQYQTTLLETSSANSLLTPKEQITRDQWIVALVCKKNTEHAMIYLEGMKKWGQHFFERYHIGADGIIGFAHVMIEEPELKYFDAKNYFLETRQIGKIRGKILRDLIIAEKNANIPFCKFSSYRGKLNCLQWCLNHLAKVDIHIDASGLGLPSHAAGKGWFS